MEQQGDELTPEETQDRLDQFLVDRLFLSQGNRLEEQRCPFAPLSPPLPQRTRILSHSRSVDNLLLVVAESQRDRIEEQRAPLRLREVRLECWQWSGVYWFQFRELNTCPWRFQWKRGSTLPTSLTGWYAQVALLGHFNCVAVGVNPTLW